MPDPTPTLEASTKTPKIVYSEDQLERLKYCRRMRKLICTWTEMLASTIKRIEQKVTKRGGPTSEQGKELVRLKRSITALYMANASFRNAIREIEHPEAGLILHVNYLRTPEGILACGPHIHDGMAQLADVWVHEGSNGLANLDTFGFMARLMQRAAQVIQDLVPSVENEVLEMVLEQGANKLAQHYLGTVGEAPSKPEFVPANKFIKVVKKQAELTRAMLDEVDEVNELLATEAPEVTEEDQQFAVEQLEPVSGEITAKQHETPVDATPSEEFPES